MVEVALAAATIASAFLAFLLWKNARSTISNNVFRSLVERYQMLEMYAAIQRLYALRDWCSINKRSISEVYAELGRRDFGVLNPLHAPPAGFHIETTLRYQRKIVSSFYYYLSTAIQYRMIPRKIAYEYWDTGTLKIIPEIILPIGVDDPAPLKRLHRDAVDYKNGTKTLKVAAILFLISWFFLTIGIVAMQLP